VEQTRVSELKSAIPLLLALLYSFPYAYPTWSRIGNPLFSSFPRDIALLDQMSYNAISVTLKHQFFPLVEPLTARYPGFYPFFYYALLASLSLLTGASVPYLWNYIMRPLIPPLFFLSVYFVGRRLMDRNRGIIAAVVASTAGSFVWIYNLIITGAFNWVQLWPVHAAFFSPSVILSSPNAEAFSLSIATLSISYLCGVRKRDSLIGGVLAGITIMSHAFVGIFLVTGIFAYVYLSQLYEVMRTRKLALVALILPAIIWVVLAALYGLIPFLWILAVSALLCTISLFYRSDNLHVVNAGRSLIVALVVSGPWWGQVASQLLYGGPAFWYEETQRMRSLHVPIDFYIAYNSFLVLPAVIGFLKFPPGPRKILLGSIALSGILLSNNHLVGLNYQPYRFIPYSFVPIALLASSGIVTLWREGSKARVFSVVFIGLILLSTLNNAGLFATYSQGVLLSPDFHGVLTWLTITGTSDEVVAAGLEESVYVRIYTEKKTLIPYPAYVPSDALQESLNAYRSLYDKSTPADLRNYEICRFHISYVLIAPEETRAFGDRLYDFGTDRNFQLAYHMGGIFVYRTSEPTGFATRESSTLSGSSQPQFMGNELDLRFEKLTSAGAHHRSCLAIGESQGDRA